MDILNEWLDKILSQKNLILHAKDPEHNIYRFYTIVLGYSLFSSYSIFIRSGRIGTKGRFRVHEAASLEEVRQFLIICLKRRLSAIRRIGAPYVPVESFYSRKCAYS